MILRFFLPKGLEAGHFPEDYDREQVREYLFYALLAAICSIYRDHTTTGGYEAYFDIPENEKRFKASKASSSSSSSSPPLLNNRPYSLVNPLLELTLAWI